MWLFLQLVILLGTLNCEIYFYTDRVEIINYNIERHLYFLKYSSVYTRTINQLNNASLTSNCRATTHTDIVVRARQMGVEFKVVHNASVMNAIGICGLQLYRYGETVSIPFFTETWKPDSFYAKIKNNRQTGLHTLCLLGTCLIFFQLRHCSITLQSIC